MEEVSQREFVRGFSKYLKAGGEYTVVGVNGSRVVRIELSDEVILSDSDNVSDKILKDLSDKVSKKLVKGTGEVSFVPSHMSKGVVEYGCGCVKEEGVVLCRKHGRV